MLTLKIPSQLPGGRSPISTIISTRFSVPFLNEVVLATDAADVIFKLMDDQPKSAWPHLCFSSYTPLIGLLEDAYISSFSTFVFQACSPCKAGILTMATSLVQKTGLAVSLLFVLTCPQKDIWRQSENTTFFTGSSEQVYVLMVFLDVCFKKSPTQALPLFMVPVTPGDRNEQLQKDTVKTVTFQTSPNLQQ